MYLIPVTYGGFDLQQNDLVCDFQDGYSWDQPSAQAVFVQRARNYPVYTGKDLSQKTIKLMMALKNALHGCSSTRDEMMKFFRVDLQNEQVLAARDAFTGELFFVNAACTAFQTSESFGDIVMSATLEVADPVWRTVDVSNYSWAITASGQQHTFVMAKNIETFAKITLTPTAYKTAGFVFRKWAPIWNQTPKQLTNYPFIISTNLALDGVNSVLINMAAPGLKVGITTITYDTEVGTFPTSGVAQVDSEMFYYTGKTATQLTGVIRGINGTIQAAHADNTIIKPIKLTEWDTTLFLASTSNFGVIQAINDSVTTIPCNAGDTGTVPTAGMIYIDTEQISYTGHVSGVSFTGCTRGINGTTAASHLINAHAAVSSIQADGDDIQVIDGGPFIPRWVTGQGTANTKVWANVNLSPGVNLFLKDTISNIGTPATITFVSSVAAKASFADLPDTLGVLLVENEAFTYTSKNLVDLSVSGITRSARGTSAATHTSGVTVHWVEHDYFILFGNQGLILDQSDDTKPTLDLTNSTNLSWIYVNYSQSGKKRSGALVPSVIKSLQKTSVTYTATQETDADPSSVMGMSGVSYQKNQSTWVGDDFELQWVLDHPLGVIQTSSTGFRFRNVLTAWNSNVTTKAKLQYQKPSGKTFVWADQWTVVMPTANSSWEAWTNNASKFTTNPTKIRFAFIGKTGNVASSRADFEIDTLTVLPYPVNQIMTVPTSVIQNYPLEAKITNLTTGEYITLTYPLLLNKSLVIDTDKNTIIYDVGTNAMAALGLSTIRQKWLKLIPGNNLLQYDDIGTQAVTALFEWQERYV